MALTDTTATNGMSDIRNKLTSSGYYFSDYDLELAEKYPEFGESMLSLKKQYANATDQAQKLAINNQANSLRSSYGAYTGGGDGSQYISNGLGAQQELEYRNELLDKYNQQYKWDGQAPTYSFNESQPTYTNKYENKQDELLNAILNREDFTWDAATDPAYQAYRQQYIREGNRATQNAISQAAANTGGLASSYAATAGAQAGNYYGAQLADMVPTLYENAYNRYLQELANSRDDLSMVNTQEQLDYNKYLNALNQYNTNRDFSLNKYQVDLGQYTADRDYGLQEYQTNYGIASDLYNTIANRDQTEYNRYLDSIEQNRYADETAYARQQQALSNAIAMTEMLGYVPAEYADIIGLPAGTKTSDAAYNDWYMNYQDTIAGLKYGVSGSGSTGSSGGSGGSSSSGGSGGSSGGSYSGGSGSSGSGSSSGGSSSASSSKVPGSNYTEDEILQMATSTLANMQLHIIENPMFSMESEIQYQIKKYGLSGQAAQLFRDYINAM